MGELHLDIIVDRLSREFKVGVNVGSPQVAYRESISGSGSATHEYRQEVGGKVQYGEVKISVEPQEEQLVSVVENFKSRDIPKEFFKATAQGILDSAPGGALAGYPFIGIKSSIDELKYDHEDSSELAYTIAASMAFKEACTSAGLSLMEPFMDLEVISPTEFAGDVISDVNAKRGRILSMNPKGDKEVITAEVPLAEMFGYSTNLRSKTQGRANFSMTFKNYELLDKNIAKKVLEKRGIFI
jgi:elongation factor G